MHNAEHYLLNCTKYHEARRELRDAVNDILESVKGEKHLTERLLLAPYNQSENINRKQDRHIKEALFQFITETRRKLYLLHYHHWFPVVLTLQLMFSQFSCFDT